ncbi:hypothetical protein BOX15_Mlig006830g1 [Macrostomum lignano]|uniref:Uncharacterized protein n=2 Tax=Macrostomum lignano TaxID=282301 RepID=A0A267H7U3_9PLAT|nr:hypothetical protein BOX15_Mlig006830g1 [Macrostomum lignano]
MYQVQSCIEAVPSALVIFFSVAFFATVDYLLKRVSQNPNSLVYHLLFSQLAVEPSKTCVEINGNHPLTTDLDLQTASSNGHMARPNKSDSSKNNKNNKIWKMQNIFLSEIHSIVSGPLAFVCVYLRPAMLEDVVSTCTPLALGLICFSLGYFVHDSIHMLRRKVSTETIELLFHHFIIFITYGLAVVQRTYVAFAVVSLFMEVNSIFLHARQLANLRRANRSSIVYRFLCAANVGTLVTFRGITTAWMVRWIWSNWRLLPLPVALLGASGLVVISVMNIVLLVRLVKADYFTNISNSQKAKAS